MPEKWDMIQFMYIEMHAIRYLSASWISKLYDRS